MTNEDTTSRDDEVRDLAYRLWEEAGHPEGRRDEFWYEARHRLAADAVAPEPVDDPRSPPPAPADPHPADENPTNVYNPAPGRRIVSEQRARDLESNPKNPGSTA